MKLFQKVKIKEFSEIQMYSNEKEKKYIGVIAKLQAEYEDIEKTFQIKTDDLKKSHELKLDNLKLQLDKANKTIEVLRDKNDFH